MTGKLGLALSLYLTSFLGCGMEPPGKSLPVQEMPQCADAISSLDRELIEAAACGDVERVISALSQGANRSAECNRDRTALQWAILNGHDAAVTVLIDLPDHQETINKQGLLFIAATFGHVTTTLLLLGRGANVSCIDLDGDTPLHWAVKSEQEATARILLEQGAYVDASNEEGQTALSYAVHYGNQKILKLLLEHGANPRIADMQGWTPLHYASQQPCLYPSSIKTLLEHGAEIDARNNKGRTPLWCAVICERIAVIQFLLRHGARPNGDTFDDDPLWIAVNNRLHTIIQTLLANGAIPSKTTLAVAGLRKDFYFDLLSSYSSYYTLREEIKNNNHYQIKRVETKINQIDEKSPLYIAIQNGHEHMVKFLLDNEVSCNATTHYGKTLLHIAVLYGREAIIKLLVIAGASLSAKDIRDQTALHLAAHLGYLNIVRMLADNQAQIDLPDEEGQTPLALAVKGRSHKVVLFLLERGVTVTEEILQTARKNNKQKTYLLLAAHNALWTAVNNGDNDKITDALRSGINPNIINAKEETPLHVASQNGHETIVSTLLERGASRNAYNKEGQTPLHSAAAGGHDDIVRLLLDWKSQSPQE
jgi:ankyrin repeat protein